MNAFVAKADIIIMPINNSKTVVLYYKRKEQKKMNNAVIYIHGKGGNTSEAEHYIPLFPDREIMGFDYRSETPWDAKTEFSAYFGKIRKQYDRVTVIANSIGAYFIMTAHPPIEKAYFISPIVDMEKLIIGMMLRANITEDELYDKKEIKTSFGETLSWKYLCYVRNNPIEWHIPTHILYGENDMLTSYEAIVGFAEKTGASLTVMNGGEHWFHTDVQMAYLDSWINALCK